MTVTFEKYAAIDM